MHGLEVGTCIQRLQQLGGLNVTCLSVHSRHERQITLPHCVACTVPASDSIGAAVERPLHSRSGYSRRLGSGTVVPSVSHTTRSPEPANSQGGFLRTASCARLQGCSVDWRNPGRDASKTQVVICCPYAILPPCPGIGKYRRAMLLCRRRAFCRASETQGRLYSNISRLWSGRVGLSRANLLEICLASCLFRQLFPTGDTGATSALHLISRPRWRGHTLAD